jgi:hypothetical protein
MEMRMAKSFHGAPMDRTLRLVVSLGKLMAQSGGVRLAWSGINLPVLWSRNAAGFDFEGDSTI